MRCGNLSGCEGAAGRKKRPAARWVPAFLFELWKGYSGVIHATQPQPLSRHSSRVP